MDAPVRTVQSIRERFESNGNSALVALRRSPVSPAQPAESEPEWHHSGSSLSSESDQGSTGTGSGGFQPHNRTSIKRSPAFRTGHKASSEMETFKKTPLRRAGPAPPPPLSPEPLVTVIVNNNNMNSNNNWASVNNNHGAKKPSLRRKPGVTRTSKPNLETIVCANGDVQVEVLSGENDPLVEEALRAPLPSGPAPKKPPRTFEYDAYIVQQEKASAADGHLTHSSTETEPEASPQRPARRKSGQQRPNRLGITPQYTMSRSKTEPSLLGKRNKSKEDASVEDLRRCAIDEGAWNEDSRWLNPVQWNSFTPAAYPWSGGLKNHPASPRLYSSMVTIAPDKSPARKGSTSSATSSSQAESGQYQVRRMSCDFFERRRPTPHDANAPPPTSLPATTMSHVYDEPSNNGDLHYMVTFCFVFLLFFGTRIDPTVAGNALQTNSGKVRAASAFKLRALYFSDKTLVSTVEKTRSITRVLGRN